MFAATPAVSAAPGVSDQIILFGQSAALEGPARALGAGMRTGVLAAFREANARGGIHGRSLELISLNDFYEPDAAIANTRRLIEKEKVFALIGGVGTPTSKAVAPIFSSAGVPYIGPFTGAKFLRENPFVVNIRASYAQEAAEMVTRLAKDLDIDQIGILHQDDSYGIAGLTSLRQAMARQNLRLRAVGSYSRNTVAVRTAVLDIFRHKPQAVVMVGTYAPTAAFVRWSRRIDFNPVFISISFGGSSALPRELGQDGAGVYVTQVVPFPEDLTLPLVAQYQKALKALDAGARPDFISLEGYIAGRLAVWVLEEMGPNVTRKAFFSTLRERKRIDLGNLEMHYDTNDNQGLDRVYMTVIDEKGQFRPTTRLEQRGARTR